MPAVALKVRELHYLSDLQAPVTATRAYVDARFPTTSGAGCRFACLVDSGAPLSVIPYSFWHDQDIQRTLLGSQLLLGGKPDPNALTWFGIPCDLGCTWADVIDTANATLTGPFLVLAKFPKQPHRQAEIENMPLLGLHFLLDGDAGVQLEGVQGRLSARLLLP